MPEAVSPRLAIQESVQNWLLGRLFFHSHSTLVGLRLSGLQLPKVFLHSYPDRFVIEGIIKLSGDGVISKHTQ